MVLPQRPAIDRDPQVHRARIAHEAERFAQLEGDTLDKLVARLLGLMTFTWLGRCTGINTAAKTATVSLDPLPGGPSPLRQAIEFQWGRETWTAAQIVGKRVRIGYSPLLGYGWIIDTVTHE